jgi:hypothetical protein
MRLIRRFATSVGLSVLLAGSATMATGALATATGGAAQAAVTGAGDNATGSVDPSSTTPGTSVTFQVFCASIDAASATFFGTTLGLPEQIPMDKESEGGVFSATVTLPGNIRPGTYMPDMDCSDGSSATATLTITAIPHGGAQTGDGTTSTETDNGLAVGGLALTGLGALAGGIALLRRRHAAR